MERRQKTFVTLNQFWPLREWGLSESLNKRKFVAKTFFSDNVE